MIHHILGVKYTLLNNDFKIKNYSSLKFSMLYQTLVFNPRIQAPQIGLNDVFFKIDYTENGCIELINENVCFTVIGWYKRSDMMD